MFLFFDQIIFSFMLRKCMTFKACRDGQRVCLGQK